MLKIKIFYLHFRSKNLGTFAEISSKPVHFSKLKFSLILKNF